MPSMYSMPMIYVNDSNSELVQFLMCTLFRFMTSEHNCNMYFDDAQLHLSANFKSMMGNTIFCDSWD